MWKSGDVKLLLSLLLIPGLLVSCGLEKEGYLPHPKHELTAKISNPEDKNLEQPLNDIQLEESFKDIQETYKQFHELLENFMGEIDKLSAYSNNLELIKINTYEINQKLKEIEAKISQYKKNWQTTDAQDSEIFDGIKVPLIVVWLIVAAVFCTIYFGFVNIRHFGTAIKIFRSNEKNAPGEVTHKQALWTACAATVGLGNIAGVAIAVSLGGPGATFWMIVAGLLGMSLKFCECTLGVKYRVINEDGSVSGGPMCYLSAGLKEIGLVNLGKYLAIFFSICCIGGALGGGNMFQANQSFQQFLNITGGESSFFSDKAWL